MRHAAACALLAFFVSLQPALARDLLLREIFATLFKKDPTKPIDYSGKNFRNLDLGDADFNGVILVQTDLSGSNLTSANFVRANLKGARLDRATITKARFVGAILQDAAISEASVHYSAISNIDEAPKFTGADMKFACLATRLEGADFRNADLTGAHIGLSDEALDAQRAGRDWYNPPASHMMRTDFTSAILDAAEIRNANFSGSTFAGARLRGAKLINLNLRWVDFAGADFNGADVSGSDFKGATLKGAKGLDTIVGLETARNLDRQDYKTLESY